jgi:hypothetical protein
MNCPVTFGVDFISPCVLEVDKIITPFKPIDYYISRMVGALKPVNPRKSFVLLSAWSNRGITGTLLPPLTLHTANHRRF